MPCAGRAALFWLFACAWLVLDMGWEHSQGNTALGIKVAIRGAPANQWMQLRTLWLPMRINEPLTVNVLDKSESSVTVTSSQAPKRRHTFQRSQIGGQMKMHRSVRFVAAAALAGSALSAVVAPALTAGANTPPPPIYANCTTFVGDTQTTQLLTGCTWQTTGTVLSTITPAAVQMTSGSSGTVLWTDKKTTTLTFAYALVTGPAEDCQTLLGVPPTAEVAETVTITGGSSKLTKGVVPTTSLVCAYSVGSDLVEVQDNGPSGTGMHF